MKVIDSLRSINAYPIPDKAVELIAVTRGINAAAEVTAIIIDTEAYRLAQADVMMWLASAPNVTQGGISYSVSPEQRKELRNHANDIYLKAGIGNCIYGYKGSRL